MQEIKFQVWDRERKVMEEVRAIDWADGQPITVSTATRKLYQHYQDDPRFGFDLRQFTGREDKNGVEIYRGDVVRCTAVERFKEESRITDVIWGDDAQWQFRAGNGYNHGLPINFGGWESLEVIGNIYYNPELLQNN